MKIFVAHIFLLGCIFMILQGAHAQQAILSSCKDASGNQGSVSYSVGQPFFFSKTGTGGNMLEGVQLPYEIFIMAGIEEITGITLACIIYPNPSEADVKLKIENLQGRRVTCELFTLNGVLLKSIKIEDEETAIPMKDLVKATYLLTVTENSKTLKIFRIIKN